MKHILCLCFGLFSLGAFAQIIKNIMIYDHSNMPGMKVEYKNPSMTASKMQHIYAGHNMISVLVTSEKQEGEEITFEWKFMGETKKHTLKQFDIRCITIRPRGIDQYALIFHSYDPDAAGKCIDSFRVKK